MSNTETDIQVTEFSGSAFFVSARHRALDIIPLGQLSPTRRSTAAIKAAYVRAAGALADPASPDGAIALVATARALLGLNNTGAPGSATV